MGSGFPVCGMCSRTFLSVVTVAQDGGSQGYSFLLQDGDVLALQKRCFRVLENILTFTPTRSLLQLKLWHLTSCNAVIN